MAVFGVIRLGQSPVLGAVVFSTQETAGPTCTPPHALATSESTVLALHCSPPSLTSGEGCPSSGII